MPLLSWQLWLARPEVQNSPLPWQKPSPDLSPGRTANVFAAVLAVIGTPAPAPKPRGKSSNWIPGQPRSRCNRYPTIRKRFRKPKASNKKFCLIPDCFDPAVSLSDCKKLSHFRSPLV
jgi:hypothetical protein